jgi:hypothetical protein
MTSQRCAELSAEAGEPLGATAVTVQNWLLVEVRGSWPRDVSDLSGFEDDERDAVRSWLEATPSSRLLFVRRPGPPRPGRLVHVVRSREDEIEVRRIELAATGKAADVDLNRDGEFVDGSLVLVCGHGTRDACCALRGSAVYGALESLVDAGALWLSSHQGGHRFAANVLVLPQGIQLGRLSPENAPGVVADALSGRIALDHYRGRTAYSPREQAAERAVRETYGLGALHELSLEGDDGSHVRFSDGTGREHLAVVEETTGPEVAASCGATPEPQTLHRARLV